MANNRIWIRCKECEQATSFAKYYPSTGWYQLAGGGLDDFFESHAHGVESIDGPVHFEFVFETDDILIDCTQAGTFITRAHN